MGILKRVINKLYNFKMSISKLTGAGISVKSNNQKIKPQISFYSLVAQANNGENISFEKYRGKKILAVNLASKCGYTPQYVELEKLHQLHKENLTVLGFPSNDFGKQEPGTDEEIATFCKVNFGVTFQLFKKDNVSGNNRQLVYQWLTDAGKNGWNDEEPSWNFYKYLIDEEGNLDKILSSSVSPLTIL